MTVSVVIETWNGADALGMLLQRLAPEVAKLDAEVVITFGLIPAVERARLERVVGRPIVWCPLSARATYYDHKNRGARASHGEILAFIDGDCEPVPGWLGAITSPIEEGRARVVAGATTYESAHAAVANPIDFPYFRARGRGARACTIDTAPATVLNFFANNVAFRREVFAPRGYPTIRRMFHGQCQVLALELWREGVPIHFAREAEVTHAWPETLRDFVKVRLLRGADAATLAPYVAASRAPRSRRAVGVVASGLSVGLFAYRAVRAALANPNRRALRFVASSLVLDSIGALARPLVYVAAGVD